MKTEVIAIVYIVTVIVRSCLDRSLSRILFLLKGLVVMSMFVAPCVAVAYFGTGLLRFAGEVIGGFSLVPVWALLVLTVSLSKRDIYY